MNHCPQCEAVLIDGARFCTQCGGEILARAAAEAPAADAATWQGGASDETPSSAVRGSGDEITMSTEGQAGTVHFQGASGRVAGAPLGTDSYDGIPPVIPLTVLLGSGLIDAFEQTAEEGETLASRFLGLRGRIQSETGVPIPVARFMPGPSAAGRGWIIRLRESVVARGVIPSGCVLASAPPEDLEVLRIRAVAARHPLRATRASWIPESSGGTVKRLYEVYRPEDVLLMEIAHVLRRHLHDLVGVEETIRLVNDLRKHAPGLVDLVVPRVIGYVRLAAVLQRLVRESVSIRDLKGILEAIAQAPDQLLDPMELTEVVRAGLALQICTSCARDDGRLAVYQVEPGIQDVILESVKRKADGTYIALDPATQTEILRSLREQFRDRPPTASDPVLLVEPRVRPFLRRIVELEWPSCHVLSFREIAPEVQVLPVGMITSRVCRSGS